MQKQVNRRHSSRTLVETKLLLYNICSSNTDFNNSCKTEVKGAHVSALLYGANFRSNCEPVKVKKTLALH